MKFKRCGIRVMVLLLLMLGLVARFAAATVPGDIAAGLPLEQVLANGLGAGLSIEAVIVQALDAGAEYCPLIKAALARGLDMARVFKVIMDHKCQAPDNVCTPCDLMKCAVLEGLDMVEAANALMAAGAQLEGVRACLGSLGYAGAKTYTYIGPEAPSFGGGPGFPGGGSGGSGVASPSL